MLPLGTEGLPVDGGCRSPGGGVEVARAPNVRRHWPTGVCCPVAAAAWASCCWWPLLPGAAAAGATGAWEIGGCWLPQEATAARGYHRWLLPVG